MDGERGLVFHVIRGSFVDGYGVRTTVFLKGCPLKCVWCCNPEGQKGRVELKVTAARCDGCGRCVPACPAGAAGLDPGTGRVQIDRRLCDGCGKCIDVCYTGALDRFGRYVTADELVAAVRKDEQFYRSSGGGVTIGGGEPTCQAAFTLELIRKCQAEYIHTALDTCGYALSPDGVRALEEADLLLFDLKGLDPRTHLAHTGVDNEPILENLRRLDALGKPLVIRVPVIPGYTDAGGNMRATADFLSGIRHVQRVDLLAFHEFGKVKYEQLGLPYNLQAPPLAEERLEEVRTLFAKRGLKVQLGG